MSLLSKSIKPQFSSIRRTLSQLFDLLASAEIIKKKKNAIQSRFDPSIFQTLQPSINCFYRRDPSRRG